MNAVNSDAEYASAPIGGDAAIIDPPAGLVSIAAKTDEPTPDPTAYLPPHTAFDSAVAALQRVVGVEPYDQRWEVLQRQYQNRSVAGFLTEGSWAGILAIGLAAFATQIGERSSVMHLAFGIHALALAFGFAFMPEMRTCLVTYTNIRNGTRAAALTIAAIAISWAIFAYAAMMHLQGDWYALAVGVIVGVIAICGTGASAYPMVALGFMIIMTAGAVLGLVQSDRPFALFFAGGLVTLILLLYLQFLRRSRAALKHVRDAAELEASEAEKRKATEARYEAERALSRAREEQREREEQRRAAKDEQRKEELLALAAQFETSVGEVSISVGSAAERFHAMAKIMARQAEAAAEQIELIAEGMDQVAAGSTSAAAASDEFAVSIENVNEQAADAARLARSTCETARATDATVSALTDRAEGIGQIAQLIDTIAGRTRLLALNASIEAARGGEAGRGFAVVASEVKELANKTSKATGDVSDSIAKMQAGSQASARELTHISAQIEQLEEAASAIASAMDQQAVAGKDLAQSIDLAASGVGEISTATQDLHHAVKAVGTASGDLLSASQSIKQQSVLLSEEVAGFLAHIRRE